MTQVAQQIPLLFEPVDLGALTDSEKNELKRRYKAGTLLDTVFRVVSSETSEQVCKVISYNINEGSLYVDYYDSLAAEIFSIDAGKI